MLTIYNCIIYDHDIRLVLLAAIICAISAFTAVKLLARINRAGSKGRSTWIFLSACSIGFGIWATHFIAMLAFAPKMPTGYDAPLTLLSLAVAVAVTGIGLAIATFRQTPDHHLVGGAIIGGGIAAMHFIGMKAFEVSGTLVWDQRFVAAALVVAVMLGAIAIRMALTMRNKWHFAAAAVWLTLAICGLHFIAMAAVTIQPDASLSISPSSIPSLLLGAGVAIAASTILLFAAIALWVDFRDDRRDQAERRMRDLVNAAVEGIVVCRDDKVITANSSFLTMADRTMSDIEGVAFEMLVTTDSTANRESAVEGFVRRADELRLPVEVLQRTIDYDGVPHTVFALRDLRERRKAEADIRHLAMHDALTGLPNRRAFSERLVAEIAAHREASNRHLGLLCLDLDRFKEVNDLFGHAAGDAMLQRVADCLSTAIERENLVARLGGDEFAIILPGLVAPDEAETIADNILKAFEEQNLTTFHSGRLASSIGIALYPTDAQDSETLVNHADTALYCAKSEGRNIWRRFDPAMGEEVRTRRMLENALRQAIVRGELGLAYQPQRELATGKIIGFEALLRWTHPELGPIPPSEFIPVAEESGVIVPIGAWVLREACSYAKQWEDDVTVAVNVSAIQLHSQEFVQTVHSILLESGLAPHRLEIEITETALVRDMNRALTALRRIKALGVKVAMDDFGTGYSSLSNLRAFPFDKIKIDGSFIRSVDTNPQAATIVKAVLGIGRGLGLPVLAEGVETTEELKFLEGEFCQIGQGYLLGRPDAVARFGSEQLQAAGPTKASAAA